jgi:hypothetical protein
MMMTNAERLKLTEEILKAKRPIQNQDQDHVIKNFGQPDRLRATEDESVNRFVKSLTDAERLELMKEILEVKRSIQNQGQDHVIKTFRQVNRLQAIENERMNRSMNRSMNRLMKPLTDAERLELTEEILKGKRPIQDQDQDHVIKPFGQPDRLRVTEDESVKPLTNAKRLKPAIEEPNPAPGPATCTPNMKMHA